MYSPALAITTIPPPLPTTTTTCCALTPSVVKALSITGGEQQHLFSKVTSSPLALSLISACMYGVWVFSQKIASKGLAPKRLQMITTVAAAMFATLNFIVSGGSYVAKSESSQYVGLAIFSGFALFMGAWLLTHALSIGGDVGMVTAVSGCYPAIVFTFSVVILGDRIVWNKLLGVIFATLAALSFAYQPSTESTNAKKIVP